MVSKLEDIIFLDIETVPMASHLSEVEEPFASLWKDKSSYIKKSQPNRFPSDMDDEEVFETAGLYSEFGKVVCISVGILYKDGNSDKYKMKLKSYYGTDEKKILSDFSQMLDNYNKKHSDMGLCGHNSKHFDFPFLCRRMLINKIPLPKVLDVADLKPWETHLYDTVEMWRFTNTKDNIALKTLCAVFGIPTPKDDIDGSEVANVFYKEQNCDRIAVYCEKDVKATIQVYLSMKGLDVIEDCNISSATFTGSVPVNYETTESTSDMAFEASDTDSNTKSE